MTALPHESWADVYDLAYQQSFGPFYDRLTEATLKVVNRHAPPGTSIIDFGAGTGRLSLPLAEQGYLVTAVEPSPSMLRQLDARSRVLGLQQSCPIRTVQAKMQDETDFGRHDMALCVFTVLLYLLDEESLAGAMRTARRAVKPGGLLLIDIPSEDLFGSYSIETDEMERTVEIQRESGDQFTYEEHIRIRQLDGSWTEYRDRFPIRYWPTGTVITALDAEGFRPIEDLSTCFAGSGSSYRLLKAPYEESSPLGA